MSRANVRRIPVALLTLPSPSDPNKHKIVSKVENGRVVCIPFVAANFRQLKRPSLFAVHIGYCESLGDESLHVSPLSNVFFSLYMYHGFSYLVQMCHE